VYIYGSGQPYTRANLEGHMRVQLSWC
jgi:hypothetical protein